MQNEKNVVENEEISLKDIIGFFRDNRKLIAVTAAAVFLLSVAYALLAPRNYEAVGFLQMAQLQQAGGGFANIETPAALTERLRYPNTYSTAALTACGIANKGAMGEYLGGMLRARGLKAMPNVLEMKIRAATPLLAMQCVESLLQMIEKQQYDLIEERRQGRAEQLTALKQALDAELRQLETIKKFDTGNFGYLARLDKLSWLRTRIDALEEDAMLAHKHPAKLTMPISASDNPASPKVKMTLLVGLLAGVFMGLLLALAGVVWRKATA